MIFPFISKPVQWEDAWGKYILVEIVTIFPKEKHSCYFILSHWFNQKNYANNQTFFSGEIVLLLVMVETNSKFWV